MKLASSPFRNSSITRLSPADPSFCSTIKELSPSKASSREKATITPFPPASPSALRTIGMSHFSRNSLARSASENTS